VVLLVNDKIDQLRKWVRDELPSNVRREVGRWLLRAADPAVPGIVQGLIREHEEEIANESRRDIRVDDGS